MPIYHGTEFPEGTTEEEANQFLAEEGQSAGAPKRLSPAERGQLLEDIEAIRQTGTIGKEFQEGFVGPVTGRVQRARSTSGLFPDEKFGRFEGDLAAYVNKARHALYGGALTPTEVAAAARQFPDVTQPPTVFMAKLRALDEALRAKAGERRNTFSQTGLDLSGLADLPPSPQFPEVGPRQQRTAAAGRIKEHLDPSGGYNIPALWTMLGLEALPVGAMVGAGAKGVGKLLGRQGVKDVAEVAEEALPNVAKAGLKVLRRGRAAAGKAEAAAEDMAGVAKRAARKPAIPKAKTPAAQVEAQPVRRSAIPKPRRPSGGPGFEVPGETAGKLRATQMLQERGYSLADINEALRRIAAGE